ncbi:MAG: hypothetical protein Q8P20_09440, partial [bacterium]|nr:hypothetical protein [bacterium]
MKDDPNFIGFLHSGDSEELIDDNALQKMHRYWVLTGLEQSKQSLKESNNGDTDNLDYKRQMSYLRRQIYFHYIKNVFLFPIWLVRLLIPSFLKGTPNLWTNIKLIASKREFHPLRMAMMAWFVFTYLLIQGGIFFFQHDISQVEAATFNFSQTNWSGGEDTVNFANHTDNRTNWTKYYSKDSGVTADASSLTLTSVTSSVIDTSSADFSAGTVSSTYVVSDSFKMLKPIGGTCSTSVECDDGYGVSAAGLCSGGVCVDPWISWVACGATSPKVIYADLTGTKAWKTSNTACDTPQCGQDGGQNGDELVSDNTVDFSLYTARNGCKAIGGRLPTLAELACIYTNRTSYNSQGAFQT